MPACAPLCPPVPPVPLQREDDEEGEGEGQRAEPSESPACCWGHTSFVYMRRGSTMPNWSANTCMGGGGVKRGMLCLPTHMHMGRRVAAVAPPRVALLPLQPTVWQAGWSIVGGGLGAGGA